MGFLNGRISWERFKVNGPQPDGFGEEDLEKVSSHAIGTSQEVTAEGTDIGFTAGEHVLDLEFKYEKNVVNDALHCALRLDTNRVPGDLLRAYMQMELNQLAAQNPSGYPTRDQKKQAREAAEDRCYGAAKDGRFRKMKTYPWLWDARQNIVYFGSSSLNVVEKFMALFKETFDLSLTRITTGAMAHELAEADKVARSLEDLMPTAFHAPERPISVDWVGDEFGSRDFLGNEFLVWLWWYLETAQDSIKLLDESEVTVMMTRTLSLQDPLAETGKDTITSDAPTRLPEAKRAVLAGKLPRKTGLRLVRHHEEYELTLQAESLAVNSAALPKLDSGSPEAERQDRIDQVRHLTETVDLMFQTFVRRRLSERWSDDTQSIRLWLNKAA